MATIPFHSNPRNPSYPRFEPPGSLFHPHAMEVQDFASYALIVDVRPRTDYDVDHIPGAVQLDPELLGGERPAVAAEGAPVPEVPPELMSRLADINPNKRLLVYCGRGGLNSGPLAAALRRRGRIVDVVGGGYVNYRRWVQTGLEVLPRKLTLHVVACALGGESTHVLDALRKVGHQVVDLAALAGWRRADLRSGRRKQPSQAHFETEVVDALRHVDNRRPVWTTDVPPRVGTLAISGALPVRLFFAPVARIDAELTLRVAQWRIDEPLLEADPKIVLRKLCAMTPKPGRALIARWRTLARHEIEPMLHSVLREYLDPSFERVTKEHHDGRDSLPPLAIQSFEPEALVRGVAAWMPVPNFRNALPAPARLPSRGSNEASSKRGTRRVAPTVRLQNDGGKKLQGGKRPTADDEQR